MRISLQGLSASIAHSEAVPGSIAGSTDRPGVDREAFRTFYSQTNGPLWTYLVRVSGRRDLADDLLQESYCRFLTADLPEMNAAESRSYLFKIATNLLRDHWRRRDSVIEAADAAAEFSEHDAETRTDVRRAFERLKPRDRQLLWLAHVEGFGHKEIARLMGLNAASIRVLLFRARGVLASMLRAGSRSGSGA